jgi:hypothetical protein
MSYLIFGFLQFSNSGGAIFLLAYLKSSGQRLHKILDPQYDDTAASDLYLDLTPHLSCSNTRAHLPENYMPLAEVSIEA